MKNIEKVKQKEVNTSAEISNSGGEALVNEDEALGDGGKASGDEGEALGDGGEASGDEGEAPGDEGEASGDEGEALGDGGEASGDGGEASGDEGEASDNGEESDVVAVKNLVAVSHILYNSKQYKPGEVIPANNMDMVEAWIEAGTADWMEQVIPQPKASPATAQAGLVGSATPPSGDDLVGRVSGNEGIGRGRNMKK